MQDRQPFNIEKLIQNKPLPFLLVVLTILLTVSISCSLPSVLSDQDNGSDNNVETSVAQTMAAQDADEGSDETDTPAPPTDTSTPDATDTPTLTPTITDTPTPEAVNVHVTGNTFCRTGPGSVYDRMGILNTDEESEIIAKNPTGEFWYVVNPDDPSQKCWIWGNYATPEGPTAGLPVYTPPPSPTPYIDFTVSFREMDMCTFYWMEFTVQNTGTMPLESFSVTVKDTDTGKTSGPSSENVFKTWKGCLDGTAQNMVSPGGTAHFMGDGFYSKTYSPKGQPMQATIKICSKDNLNGMCVTRNVSFTP